ncbi:MAG: PGPGW domain-containing protein [Phycisphaerales bacterium]
MPWVLVRLPSDYFVRDKRVPLDLPQRHPMIRVTVHVLKNLLGAVLLVGGIAMLVLPGQGLLTMLLGLSLINFPGKFWLERKLIQRRAVNRSVNWIRRKGGREPMVVPDREPKRAG